MLGKGVFASVRLARDDDGKAVAIKTYENADMQENSYVVRHMQNEARLAGKIDHEGVIAPRAVVRKPSGVELHMDYASGGNLGEYVKKQRSGVPEAEAKRLFRQIVEAVGYLHSKDICHRDIKLENIVLDEQRNAKLVDFGAAREGAHRMLHSVQGTPAYMAPEVIGNRAHNGAASDVWSLGVTLFSLLVPGDFPFWGKNMAELRRNIAQAPLKLPAQLSPPCRDLLTKMLNKQAAQRMSIADVKRHPWLRGTGPMPPPQQQQQQQQPQPQQQPPPPPPPQAVARPTVRPSTASGVRGADAPMIRGATASFLQSNAGFGPTQPAAGGPARSSWRISSQAAAEPPVFQSRLAALMPSASRPASAARPGSALAKARERHSPRW